MINSKQRSKTQRVVLAGRPGGPETLSTTTLESSDPAADEVAIDIAFAGVNFAEVAQRQGVYPVPAWPFTPGLEVSGTVAAIGDEVSGIAVGDRVAAFCVLGGYAERVVVPAARVYPLADQVGFEQAAASVVAVISAVAMLERLAAVGPGATVVVTAAAGGVGSVAAQVARGLGAERLIGAVGSEAKVAVALEHGYDLAVTYGDLARTAREATGGRGADAALDSVGGSVLDACLDALAPLGRLVKYGSASGEAEELPEPMRLAVENKSVMGWSSADLALERPDRLRPIAERALGLIADGSVRVPVTDVLGLDDAAEAHRRLEERRTLGKLLLDPGRR
jgi:NADPH:quinone reductase